MTSLFFSRILRECVGSDSLVMVDANQKWSVNEAIEWMEQLKDFQLTWIEEPTSPDDVLGHLKISKALEKYGQKFFLKSPLFTEIFLNFSSSIFSS